MTTCMIDSFGAIEHMIILILQTYFNAFANSSLLMVQNQIVLVRIIRDNLFTDSVKHRFLPYTVLIK